MIVLLLIIHNVLFFIFLRYYETMILAIIKCYDTLWYTSLLKSFTTYYEYCFKMTSMHDYNYPYNALQLHNNVLSHGFVEY